MRATAPRHAPPLACSISWTTGPSWVGDVGSQANQMCIYDTCKHALNKHGATDEFFILLQHWGLGLAQCVQDDAQLHSKDSPQKPVLS